MNKNFINIVLLVFLFNLSIVLGQYNIQSEYLLHPEKNIDYIVDEAEYWKQFYDQEYGGFFSFVDADGNITNQDVKALCPQSRLGYAYARAFMVTGDTTYLHYAHRALKFLYSHGWDEANGGWYFTTNRSGEVVDGQGWWDKWNTTYKEAFQQHYALLGIGALCDATGGDIDWGEFLDNPEENGTKTDWDWLMQGYDLLMDKMWDARQDFAGHYDVADVDWNNPRDKGFTPVGDAMTTNAVILYLLNRNPDIKNRLLTLADNIVDHLAASMDDPRVKFGFAEVYNSDWEINTDKHKNLLGHVYKAAWCVSRAYMVDPQEKYRLAAQKLLNHMWDDGGYDKEYGGPYKKYDYESGVITDSSKNHWTLEQGALSGLINYYIAEDDGLKDIYLQMADESIDFYMENIRDFVNGGSFSETNRDGSEVTDSNKGNVFGANYHGTELAYFAYLYSSIFLKDTTVTLYYYFQPKNEERKITLYPFAFPDEKLQIKEVTLNDTLFLNFEKEKRLLTIASGIGGLFKVIYETKKTPSFVNTDKPYIGDFRLYDNYPNPFNPYTIIKYTVGSTNSGERNKVSMKVFDALGRQVAILVNKRQAPGTYQARFNGAGLPSGVYYYRLKCGNYSQTNKMILIR